MDFDGLTKKRKSCRSFIAGKSVDWHDVVDIVDSANQIPSAGSISIIKSIMVEDAYKIAKLADACQQDFIRDAPVILVVCSQKDQLLRNFEKKGEVFAHQEAGAAINNILLASTEKGLASCWIGHFSDRLVKRVMKIPKDIDIEALIAIGHASSFNPMGKGKVYSRPKIGDTLYFEKWEEKKRK
jgi:nitroreductase